MQAAIYVHLPFWVNISPWVVDGWRKGSNAFLFGGRDSHMLNHRKRRIRKKWRKRVTLVMES